MINLASIEDLAQRYDALFFDAYGVLITAQGAMPHADALIQRLNAANKTYFILTNGASRTPAKTAAHYQSAGLAISEDRIITSGMLLKDYFKQHALAGSRTWVLGTEDSATLVREAGGQIAPVEKDGDFDVLVVANQSDYPFLPTVDTVLSVLCRKWDAGERPHLVLPNPDIMYPKSADEFGITSGGVALLFEAALKLRYGADENSLFTRLGKPHGPMFAKAVQLAGTRNALMIGDQLELDIRGAKKFGLDAALFTGGLTHRDAILRSEQFAPDYLLDSLAWN